MTGFGEALFRAVLQKESVVVVGIDPDPIQIPREFIPSNQNDPRERLAIGVSRFAQEIITSVADVCVAIKPQLAYFERLGPAGLAAYEDVVTLAKREGLIVIADGKRNDIGSTAEQYAAAYLGTARSEGRIRSQEDQHRSSAGNQAAVQDHELDPKASGQTADQVAGQAASNFSLDVSELLDACDSHDSKAHALTVNAYMGKDSLEPFLKRVDGGKGIFVLAKTSNPSSGDLQDRIIEGQNDSGRSVYEHVATWVDDWSRKTIGSLGYGSVGAVVGATYPRQLAQLRQAMPYAPLLIPGYGAQGATAKDVAAGFDKRGLGAVVNASRSIAYAYRRFDHLSFEKASRRAATEMRDALREAVPLRID